MIQILDKIDKELFLFLNGLHHENLDPIMDAISYSPILGILFLIIIVFLLLKFYKQHFFKIFFFLLLTFGFGDFISTKGFKDNFERLRPCHQKELKPFVHLGLETSCGGGKFGFVSSHATNTFSIAMFLWLLLRRKTQYSILFFGYASLVGYSRIYLARHFPGDIVFGALLGCFIAYCMIYLLKIWIKRKDSSFLSHI